MSTNNDETFIPISLEAINKELGIPSEADASAIEEALQLSKTPATKLVGSFLTKQFTLFSLPIVSVYLQGVLPSAALNSFEEAIKHAKVRPINNPTRKALPEKTEPLIANIKTNFSRLYSAQGKEWHLAVVKEAMSLGLKVDPSKCLKKESAIKAFEAYQSALIDFLIAENYSTPEDYLARNKEASQDFSLTDLESLELDF